MQGPQMDVGKLVGAASAPVALIIATSIFLSNLGAKYAMLVGIFREIAREYRGSWDKKNIRSESLYRQMQVYARRIRMLMRATFWLTLSILCFISTVFFTGVGVIFPKMVLWTWVTGFLSFAGLLILAAAVLIELAENETAKELLLLETAGLQNVLAETDLGDADDTSQEAK